LAAAVILLVQKAKGRQNLGGVAVMTVMTSCLVAGARGVLVRIEHNYTVRVGIKPLQQQVVGRGTWVGRVVVVTR
jgi:hypothetical protein